MSSAVPAPVNLYALPVIGRAGLGNSLFPWARAEVFARRCDVPILAPYWGKFRAGPYLRREPEKRRYSAMFRAEHHVRGFQRLVIAALGRRVMAEQAREVPRSRVPVWPRVVEFEGIGDLFEPLSGEHDFIRRRLWEMTRPVYRPDADQNGRRYVAMHVRRGDITRQGFSDLELDEVKQYTPLPWFEAMTRAVRRVDALRSLPIVVFTDGSPDEVEPLCRVDGVRLQRASAPIADLWALAGAGLLFASGYSTFGMWASFLGGMPTVYAPGKIQQRVLVGRPHAVEIELKQGEDLPQNVLARLEESTSRIVPSRAEG